MLLPHVLYKHNDCIRAAFAIDNDGQKGSAGPAEAPTTKVAKVLSSLNACARRESMHARCAER